MNDDKRPLQFSRLAAMATSWIFLFQFLRSKRKESRPAKKQELELGDDMRVHDEANTYIYILGG
jgi:hypothetical protein